MQGAHVYLDTTSTLEGLNVTVLNSTVLVFMLPNLNYTGYVNVTVVNPDTLRDNNDDMFSSVPSCYIVGTYTVFTFFILRAVMVFLTPA